MSTALARKPVSQSERLSPILDPACGGASAEWLTAAPNHVARLLNVVRRVKREKLSEQTMTDLAEPHLRNLLDVSSWQREKSYRTAAGDIVRPDITITIANAPIGLRLVEPERHRRPTGWRAAMRCIASPAGARWRRGLPATRPWPGIGPSPGDRQRRVNILFKVPCPANWWSTPSSGWTIR